MKAKHLDYILDCIIEKFLSISNEKDIKEFESKYADYKYNLGFQIAIKGWSNNKLRREISLCRLIDAIEQKNMINVEENIMIEDANMISAEESLQDTHINDITHINDSKEK